LLQYARISPPPTHNQPFILSPATPKVRQVISARIRYIPSGNPSSRSFVGSKTSAGFSEGEWVGRSWNTGRWSLRKKALRVTSKRPTNIGLEPRRSREGSIGRLYLWNDRSGLGLGARGTGGIGDGDRGLGGKRVVDWMREGRGGSEEVSDVLFALKCHYVFAEEPRSEWRRVRISILPLPLSPVPPFLPHADPTLVSKPSKHSTVL
jgi:hypothetical protein